MKSPNEVKARAGRLREVLSAMGHQLKHTESLEVISKYEGYPNWNTYTAELAKRQQSADESADDKTLDDKNNKDIITPPDPMKMPQESKIVWCSFCGRTQHEVDKLIAGPSVFICNLCTDLCIGIVLEELAEDEIAPDERDMPNLASLVQNAQGKEN